MVGNQKSDFVVVTRQVNLWNMASSSMTTSAPGYNAGSKTIASDGTISYTNSSGSSASRIQLTMPASAMGLVNGVEYTVKVWILDNDLSSTRESQIYASAPTSMWSSGYGYRNVRGPSPVSITFTQSNDNDIKVGLLYADNYSVGATFSIRVMVSERDHIDDYVPFSF